MARAVQRFGAVSVTGHTTPYPSLPLGVPVAASADGVSGGRGPEQLVLSNQQAPAATTVRWARGQGQEVKGNDDS